MYVLECIGLSWFVSRDTVLQIIIPNSTPKYLSLAAVTAQRITQRNNKVSRGYYFRNIVLDFCLFVSLNCQIRKPYIDEFATFLKPQFPGLGSNQCYVAQQIRCVFNYTCIVIVILCIHTYSLHGLTT